jgi:hypothetical protein
MFFSLARQWTNLTSADRQFTEYVDNLVHRSALERRPAKYVRALVLVKAGELSIPVEDQSITVTGLGDNLGTAIAYEAEIKIPLIDRTFYRMEFTHNFRNKPPR